MRFFILCILSPLFSFGQIQIDKAGDFWDLRVDSALKKIRSVDSVYYSRILEVCDTVSFWESDFSSCEGSYGQRGTILMSARDVSSGNIYNICAVLVHESAHLKIAKSGLKFRTAEEEEIFCYAYELEFLRKLPGVSKNLLRHAENQIRELTSHLKP